jgi:hypothetical protein
MEMNGETGRYFPKKQTALRFLISLYLPRTAILVDFPLKKSE